jgi:flagellar basal body-associated protein FliL
MLIFINVVIIIIIISIIIILFLFLSKGFWGDETLSDDDSERKPRMRR